MNGITQKVMNTLINNIAKKYGNNAPETTDFTLFCLMEHNKVFNARINRYYLKLMAK